MHEPKSTSSALADVIQAEEAAAKLGGALDQQRMAAPGPITEEHVERLLSPVQPRPPYEDYPQAQLARLTQSGSGKGGRGIRKTCASCSQLTGGELGNIASGNKKQVLKQKLAVAGAPTRHDCDYFAMRFWVYQTWQRLVAAGWHNRESAA